MCILYIGLGKDTIFESVKANYASIKVVDHAKIKTTIGDPVLYSEAWSGRQHTCNDLVYFESNVLGGGSFAISIDFVLKRPLG